MTELYAVKVAPGGSGPGGRLLADRPLVRVPAPGSDNVLPCCRSRSNVGCKPTGLPAFVPSEPTFALQIMPFGLFKSTVRRPRS